MALCPEHLFQDLPSRPFVLDTVYGDQPARLGVEDVDQAASVLILAFPE
jgi:hypothetical protein